MSRALRVCLAVLMLAALPGAALAAEGTAPPSAAPVSFVNLVQVVFALLVVLGAIGLFAWLMRRLVPGHSAAGGILKVVGGVMVGPRERLVVVEVGDNWLLLGVSAGGVNLVHSMPRPPAASAVAGEPRMFARALRAALAAKRPGG
jgi:flagellar protein FliO/FliZ